MTIASEKAEPQIDPALMSEEQKRELHEKRAQRTRQKQSLNLQRERILSQRTSNPGRRAALEAALKDIEAQIATLG